MIFSWQLVTLSSFYILKKIYSCFCFLWCWKSNGGLHYCQKVTVSCTPQLSLSSLKKYLFRSFVQFIWIMCGTCVGVYVDMLSCLSILDIWFLLDKYFTYTYDNSIHCFSSVSVVSFALQKFVVLTEWFSFATLCFYCLCFWVHIQSLCLFQCPV